MKSDRKPLIITMLLISLFQMGMVALSPVVASITSAFPGTSQTAAQLSMTFLCLVISAAALFSGRIAQRIGRRAMCILGMLLCTVVGICGTLVTRALWMTFLWSALLGISIGLFVPAVSSMMIDYLNDAERSAVAGLQTAFVNLGGMALSFLSGLLALQRWCNAYLVFLFAAPVLFLCVRFIPKEQQERSGTAAPSNRGKIPTSVWLASLQTFVFAIFYFAFSTNISLLLTERGMVSTSLAGTATSVFMLGGCLFGFLFSRVVGIAKCATPSTAFLLVAASYLLIFFCDGVVPLMIGAFIGGGSLSLIFPYFLVTIAGQVDSSASVISSSLILSVAPNLGSFVSPMLLTSVANIIFGTVSGRFLLAAICCVALAGAFLAMNLKRAK